MSRRSRFRRTGRPRTGLVGPLILILIGGVLWLREAGALDLTSQLGGLLVLVPAVALLVSAVPAAIARRYRPAVARALAGLILAGVSAMLLFGWELGQYWSLLLVGAGILLLLPALLPSTPEQPSDEPR